MSKFSIEKAVQFFSGRRRLPIGASPMGEFELEEHLLWLKPPRGRPAESCVHFSLKFLPCLSNFRPYFDTHVNIRNIYEALGRCAGFRAAVRTEAQFGHPLFSESHSMKRTAITRLEINYLFVGRIFTSTERKSLCSAPLRVGGRTFGHTTQKKEIHLP